MTPGLCIFWNFLIFATPSLAQCPFIRFRMRSKSGGCIDSDSRSARLEKTIFLRFSSLSQSCDYITIQHSNVIADIFNFWNILPRFHWFDWNMKNQNRSFSQKCPILCLKNFEFIVFIWKIEKVLNDPRKYGLNRSFQSIRKHFCFEKAFSSMETVVTKFHSCFESIWIKNGL